MKRPRFDLLHHRQARRGVTLLEIILAMGLLVTVTSMTYWFYSSSLESGREGTKAAQKIRLARVVLDRITKEIRQAASITADNRVGVRGLPERIWLSTYRVPTREQIRARSLRDKPRPGEYDLTKVEYKIVRHPEVEHEDGYDYPLGLARIEIRIPRPDSAERLGASGDRRLAENITSGRGGRYGVDGAPESLAEERLAGEDEERGDVSLGPDIRWDELYASEIRYLRFCYYDGHSWWDTWEVSGESPLPQLVQVTIGFEPHPPFEHELELDEVNDEFCTCLNEDPVECVPLARDQYSTVVRLEQADPLFRSRISRETQALVQELAEGAEEDEE
jgi:hypothetical protein